MASPTLLIDGNDVTEEINGKELSFSLNTLDTTLRDPTNLPMLGDDVEAETPEWGWAGIVVSVSVQDNDRDGHTWVRVTAKNEESAAVTAAPFDLVDADGDYRHLTITRTLHDDVEELRGTLETLLPGLLPGMTFELTSENHGYDAADFGITDVKVSWLRDDTPIYRVSFGDAIVDMSVWANSTTAGVLPITTTKITDDAVTTPKIAAGAITTELLDADAIIANVANVGDTVVIDSTGIAITDGALTFEDEFGNNVLTGAGFGTSWLDFIANGFYNDHFQVGSTTSIIADTLEGTASTEADYLTSVSGLDLPYWCIASESGAGTLKRVADSTAVGGFALQWDGTETAQIFQDIPIQAGQSYSIQFSWRYTNSASEFSKTLGFQFRAADHSAIGSVVEQGLSFTGSQAAYVTDGGSIGVAPAPAPADARYLRVLFTVARTSGSPTVWLNSFSATPTTHWRNLDIIDLGALRIVAAPGDSNPYTRLDSGGLELGDGSASTDVFILRPAANTISVAQGNLLRTGGTSFPASPTSGDLFYRTDLAGWYYWNGTYWLSQHLSAYSIPVGDAASLPFSATSASSHRAAWPMLAKSDIWIEAIATAFYVNGGTALSGSHKWVGVLVDGATATTLDTCTIASGASGAWRSNTGGGGLIGSASVECDVTWTKTGTPGTLYVAQSIQYRLRAT